MLAGLLSSTEIQKPAVGSVLPSNVAAHEFAWKLGLHTELLYIDWLQLSMFDSTSTVAIERLLKLGMYLTDTLHRF